MLNKFPFFKQLDAMDCGATCLRMIAKYYGKTYTLKFLREMCYTDREGVSLLGISDAAERIGLRTLCARLSFSNVKNEAPLPFIAYWRERHFVVVYKINKKYVYIADPGHGLLKLSITDFIKGWANFNNNNEEEGFALFLEPSPNFYEQEDDNKKNKVSLAYYFNYLKPYKKYFTQIFIGLIVSTAIQLIFPFTTQALVDIGINTQDISFIYLILLAQLILFLSRTTTEFIRSWLLLHITSRINISILSDFLIKLMKLPVSFFDKKVTGDIIQRMQDHSRIQDFLTTSSLNTLFSIINIIIFGGILAFYNIKMFLIFFFGSIVYLIWITLFLNKRKELDYKNFEQSARIQNSTIQLLSGMQEIKLQSCEKQKRWEWEKIQAKLFKLNIKSLVLGQIEGSGAGFINEFKNILLTFYAAKSVIDGEMTLGMMLASQYIIGQLNGPVIGLIGFTQTAQSAKISMERLGEIHNMNNEESESLTKEVLDSENSDISIENLSFQYGGPRSTYVLKDLNLKIPSGKVTAIVGSSGSGKTTLLKLLLKFYPTTEGKICFGNTNINDIQFKVWRDKFGVVMQESFIFSDSIAENIIIGTEKIQKEKLKEAAKIANIREFVEKLPLGYNTKIGPDGQGISQGQRQRLLIARAVYKDPKILLLDEATNSLDAQNEKVIINNLNDFFKGRTVVVVAHRLSTVKNADQIVVLDQGKVVEIGTHKQLIELKGSYFNLIKNQLELGD